MRRGKWIQIQQRIPEDVGRQGIIGTKTVVYEYDVVSVKSVYVANNICAIVVS
jgi:hypothetical protein